MVDLKASVTLMIEQGWNQGKTEVFAPVAADPMRFHYAGVPRELSVDELCTIVGRWRAAFPDLRMEIDELVTEGDIVAALMTFTGTHMGPWAGAEPTGRQIRMAMTLFFRFEDGTLVEIWELDDQLGFRRQLGLIN